MQNTSFPDGSACFFIRSRSICVIIFLLFYFLLFLLELRNFPVGYEYPLAFIHLV